MAILLMKKINKLINNVKRTMFTSSLDTFISLFITSILFVCTVKLSKWFFLKANWTVVEENIPLFLFGVFPADQRWRPSLWLIILISLVVLTLFTPSWSFFRKLLPFAWIAVIPIGIALLAGGIGLSPVASRYWGGLTLTIFLMMSSLFLAFPFGIILAFGRQSKLQLIKYFCSIYIETLRAIPLISILFFGQLLIPLFLPVEIEINRVLRSIIAFTLFVSAYIAEDIRGGLQAIPKSQIEAAKSLGFNTFQITRFILLPQVLQIALPALTNQAVGLLQNTSLMSILGLVELLGISRSLLANPKFIGQYMEVYVWLAAIYWFICTIMALVAQNIERKTTLVKLI